MISIRPDTDIRLLRSVIHLVRQRLARKRMTIYDQTFAMLADPPLDHALKLVVMRGVIAGLD